MKINKQFEEAAEREMKLTIARLKDVEKAIDGDLTSDQVCSHFSGMAQRLAHLVEADIFADEEETNSPQ